MKTWNKPEMTELEVSMTMSGDRKGSERLATNAGS